MEGLEKKIPLSSGVGGLKHTLTSYARKKEGKSGHGTPRPD
jgi:hypothetical protein